MTYFSLSFFLILPFFFTISLYFTSSSYIYIYIYIYINSDKETQDFIPNESKSLKGDRIANQF